MGATVVGGEEFRQGGLVRAKISIWMETELVGRVGVIKTVEG
jgi:hypothetical protein